MRISKILIIAALIGLIFPASAFAGKKPQDPISKASRYYKDKHYQYALESLFPFVNNISEQKKSRAHLLLGLILSDTAQLYKQLSASAVDIEREYLQRILKTKGKNKSQYAHLFLAKIHLKEGKPNLAISEINRFLQTPASGNYVAYAKLLRYQASKMAGKKATIPASIRNSKKSLIRSDIYYIHNILGDMPNRDRYKSVFSKNSHSIEMLGTRGLKNILTAHLNNNNVTSAIAVALESDFSIAEYKEEFKNGKYIYFYDIDLLDTLASVWRQAAVHYFGLAAKDQKYTNISYYYKAKLLTHYGSIPNSPAYQTQSLPQKLQYNGNLLDNVIRSKDLLDKFVFSDEKSIDKLNDQMEICNSLALKCEDVLNKSSRIADAAPPKQVAKLNSLIGQKYLDKKDIKQALTYLEAGRNKAHKNKIKYNEPKFLVSLADAHSLSNSYSESLEIYFELGKQFGAVRQIQEALQGIYAMEQRSAGDVKIF